jgi:hypothetical protein
MSGNHDIGIRDGIKLDVFQRFQTQFGPTSSVHSLAYNHTMVILDTVALTSTNPETKLSIQHDALAVMNEMGRDTSSSVEKGKNGKRVLLTHVPLYRPEQTSCGPLRVQSRPYIYQGYGYQYQNLMEEDVSRIILQHIQPDLIFSGDDHDFCEVTHAYHAAQQQRLALEYTAPTFSMSQGVRQPGYMLLQATEDKLVPQLCWLPDQLGIFIKYGLLAGLTLITFFVRCLSQLSESGSLPWSDRKKKMKLMKQEDEENMMDSFVVVGGTDLALSSTTSIAATALSSPSSSSAAKLSSPIKTCLHDIKDVVIVALPFYIACTLFL